MTTGNDQPGHPPFVRQPHHDHVGTERAAVPAFRGETITGHPRFCCRARARFGGRRASLRGQDRVQFALCSLDQRVGIGGGINLQELPGASADEAAAEVGFVAELIDCC